MGETKKKDLKKLMIGLLITITLVATVFAGCVSQENTDTSIVVVTRESTSGTYDYVWKTVLNQENFSADAIGKTSNGEVHDFVAQTPLAIGYVGLGYVDSQVKALKIEDINGVAIAPSVSTVIDKSYPLSRDLFMATEGNATGIASDFIDFILSSEGQAVVAEEGFVPLTTSVAFDVTGRNTTGTLSISGSTTVQPIASKAQEAYHALFPNVVINIAAPGSNAGIQALLASTVDLAMSSRVITQAEMDQGLVPVTISHDGVAIIVNPSNNYVANDTLTMAQLKSILTGQITDWTQL